VVWTCAAAKQHSEVFAVESKKISLSPIPEGRRRTVQLSRKKGTITLLPQVEVGDVVEAHQIVASVVPVNTNLQCPPTVEEAYFTDKLASVNLSERYAAAKALRYRGYTTAKPTLESRMKDCEEDIYVQLEAAAALAAYDDESGWEFIESKLNGPAMAVPLETQLETIIVASEIPSQRSERILINVLRNNDRDDELRAGAAWALGQFVSASSAAALVDTFNSSALEIKIEAARALLRIAEPQIPHLVDLLKNSEPAKRDGISWALARAGNFNPLEIVAGADDNLRTWISYIVGYGRDNFAQADVEAICNADPEVYFAASVLWQIVTSWVHELREF